MANKPKWPTWRGARLTDEVFVQLTKLPHLMMIASGRQYGSRMGGASLEDAAVSLELQRYIVNNQGEKKPLYVSCWLAAYEINGKSGIVPHLSWQYPHMLEFDSGDLAWQSWEVYSLLAQTVYTTCGVAIPYEIAEFITPQ